MRITGRRRTVAIAATAAAALAACTTLQQIAALRQVEFVIDRVADARLAGVNLDNIRNYQQISALDVARIAAALSRGDLPLDFDLHIGALNPATNQVAARLIQMDWTLLLDERETVTGRIDREMVFEPGVPADLPLTIHLDLADFFQDNARDMVDLALAVAGAGGEPKRVSVRAIPTIQTALGPIRYPQPITIVSAELGATGTSR